MIEDINEPPQSNSHHIINKVKGSKIAKKGNNGKLNRTLKTKKVENPIIPDTKEHNFSRVVVPKININQGYLNMQYDEHCHQQDVRESFESGSQNDHNYSFSRSKSKLLSDMKNNFDDSTLHPIDESRMNYNTQTFGGQDCNQNKIPFEDTKSFNKTISAIDQSVGVIEINNNENPNIPDPQSNKKTSVSKKKKITNIKGKKKVINKSIQNTSKNVPKNNNKENIKTNLSGRKNSLNKNQNFIDQNQYKSTEKQYGKGNKIPVIVSKRKTPLPVENIADADQQNIFNEETNELDQYYEDDDQNCDAKEVLREKILEHINKLHEAQAKHNKEKNNSRDQHIIVKEYNCNVLQSDTAFSSKQDLRDVNDTAFSSKINLREIDGITLNSKQNLRDVNLDSEIMKTESNLSDVNIHKSMGFIPEPHKFVKPEPYMNVDEGCIERTPVQIYQIRNESSFKYHNNLETIPSTNRTHQLLNSPHDLINLKYPVSYRTDNSELFFNNNNGKTPEPNFRVSDNYLTTYTSNKYLGHDFALLEQSDLTIQPTEKNFSKTQNVNKNAYSSKQQQKKEYSTNVSRNRSKNNTRRSSQEKKGKSNEKKGRSNSRNKTKPQIQNHDDFRMDNEDIVLISNCMRKKSQNKSEDHNEIYLEIQGSGRSKDDVLDEAYESIGAKDLQRRQGFNKVTKANGKPVKNRSSVVRHRSVDKDDARPFDNTTLMCTNKFSKNYNKPIEYKENKNARCAKNYVNYIRFFRKSGADMLDNPKKYQSLAENRSKTPNRIGTQPNTSKEKQKEILIDKIPKPFNATLKPKNTNVKTTKHTANNSLDNSMQNHLDMNTKIWTQIHTPDLEKSPQKKVKHEDFTLNKGSSTYDKFIKSQKLKGTIINSKRIKQFFTNSKQLEYEGNYRENKREGFGVLYHKNGIIKYSGYFKNNNLHGKDIKLYNEDQSLNFEGEISEGRKEGFGILYHENGFAYYKGNFKKNRFDDQNGKLYHKNGVLQFEGSIKEGKKQGYGKLFHSEGTLQFTGNFKNDEIHQKSCTLYKSGLKTEKINFRNELSNSYSEINMGHIKIFEGDILCGKKNGPGKSYDQNGKLQFEGTYRVDKKHGLDCKIYDPNTHLLSYQGEMKNNTKDGHGILYHTNIDKLDLGHRDSSSKINNPLEFVSSGKNISYHYIYKGNFKNNKIHNENARIYFPNGVIKYCGKVIEGLYQGFANGHWEETGKIKFEGVFKDNLYNGPNVKTYHTNGALEYEGNMLNGKRSKVGILYHKNGKPIYAGTFKADKIHGESVKMYFDNGKLKFEGNMEEGLKQGFGKSWSEDGNLIYEGNYHQDLRHGKSCIEYQNCEDQGNYSCKSWPLYVGEMHQGTRRGFGRIYHKNGKLMFAGNFKAIPICKIMYVYAEDGSIRYIGPPKFVPAEFY